MPRPRSVFPPSLEDATVADAMRPGIVSCPADASATKVARIMATHHVHCVLVMHTAYGESGQPYVWGIISDLDLMRAVLDRGETQTAGSMAGQPIISVKTTLPLTDACALMVKDHVSHLVVTDPETLAPIGVLSTTDVADIFAWGEA
jgi:CBS domain-containing protein